MDLPLPLALRSLSDEVEERLARIPTAMNEYGFDPFGASLDFARRFGTIAAFLYRHYFRVETQGIEKVPDGRVLLIANHAGNTLPMDGAMLATAMLLDAEPPRFVRAMAEFYLPRIPWWSEMIHRGGAVVGTPENCVRLLEREEAIMVFPEGSRGFIKPFAERYKLQRFGTGFARLALQTKTPIVPVGIVGSEEQSPGLVDSKNLARLIGAPAFPVTWFFPWLGLLGFVPLPVKYRIHFGDPIRLEGDPNDDDEGISRHVARVKDEIALLIEEGLAQRQGWFR
jgi:1-acyl-sn-glycerol-3-phosphate acyltransferase